MYTWGVLKDIAKHASVMLTMTEPCSNPEFLQGQRKKRPSSETPNMSTWSYDMEGHAKKCVERYFELANKTTEQLYKVSTPCIDDHQFKEELKSVGEFSEVCSQIVLRCFFWHELVDQIFCGQSTNLHVRSQSGPELVANV